MSFDVREDNCMCCPNHMHIIDLKIEELVSRGRGHGIIGRHRNRCHCRRVIGGQVEIAVWMKELDNNRT